jgi:hypothetical protein
MTAVDIAQDKQIFWPFLKNTKPLSPLKKVKAVLPQSWSGHRC